MKQFIVTSIIIFLLVSLFMYIFQRRFIYIPLQFKPNPQQFHAQDMQPLELKTEDGFLVNAWYKAATPSFPTILYLHGNAGHIGYRMPLVRPLLDAGFGVLLLEYRGYGGNIGNPSEKGLYADSRAALQFLKQQKIPSNQIILYGESLGSGVAVQMAVESSVCAVILQSPFTSLTALAHYHYPWIILSPWDKYDSLNKVAKIKAPLLILHGKRDTIVPFSQAVSLFEQAHSPKQMVPFENKGHNDLWNSAFLKEILHFLQTYCF